MRGGLAINSIIILLLATSVIISVSAGIEPKALGQGKTDKALNLDVGSMHSSVSPHFGMNGFAPPLIPQPMELDPGAMVSQSERLRDQSLSLRDQTGAIYNETAVLMDKTSAFAEQVGKDAVRVEDLKEDASLNANLSLRSALLAEGYLNDTRSLYGDVRTLYNWTKISERKVEMSSRMGTIGSPNAYNNMPMGTGDVASLRQQVAVLSQRVDALERKVSELEKKT